jgi:hypothetical protein
VKEANDHSRVTPEGRAAGLQVAALADKAVARLDAQGEPDERCRTCAFRLGTVPNGCAQTQSDAMKCVVEGIPFTCHQRLGNPCHGWYALRAALKNKIPAGMTVPWKLSPPDEDFEVVEKAHAKRERRAAHRMRLAAAQKGNDK